jgi:glycosyltransferase involved in cell wall biosynthesis
MNKPVLAWDKAKETLNERIIKSRKKSLFKRTLNIFLSYLLINVSYISSMLGRTKILQNRRKRNLNQESYNIILTGRFEAYGWLRAHLVPLANADRVNQIYLVSDDEFGDIEKTTYLCPPKLLQKLIGRSNARYVWLIYQVAKLDIHYIGGFHLLFNGLLAHMLASVFGVGSIYFCVGGWSEVLGGGAFSGTKIFGETGVDSKKLEEKLLKIVSNTTLVVTMGSRAEGYFQNKHPSVNTMVIPGGLEGSRFSSKKENQVKLYDLILVARLDPIKRIDIFIKILAELNKNNNVTAVIVGDGPLKQELQNLAQTLNISKQIEFAGYKQNVSSWLNKSRIFMLTSDSEGLPLSIMEALTCGLPVISSKVGDIADIIIDGSNGFLVEPRDIPEFTAKAESLLLDPKSYDSMSDNAMESGSAYSSEKIAQKWNQAFIQVI